MRKGTESGLDSPRGVCPGFLMSFFTDSQKRSSDGLCFFVKSSFCDFQVFTFPALLLTVECVAGTTREHQIKVELLFAQSVISIVSTLCQFLPGTAAGEFPEQESDCDPRNATVGELKSQSLPHQQPCNVLTRNIFDQQSHQSVRLMVTGHLGIQPCALSSFHFVFPHSPPVLSSG